MRYRLILLCILLAVNVANAKELKIFSKGIRYTLTYNRDKILLDGNRHRLSLARTKCNHEIVAQFNRDMDGLLKKISRTKGIRTPWHYVVDGVKFPTDYQSKGVRPLLFVPEEVRRIKLQNKYMCQQ